MNLKDRIGKEVRIFSFFYDKGDKIPYNIFTIIEEVHPWMQDYDAFEMGNGKPFFKSESYKKRKILLTVFKTNFSEAMIGEAGEPRIFIGGDLLKSFSGDIYLLEEKLLSSDDKIEIKGLLPVRDYSSFLTFFGFKKIPEQLEKLISDKKFIRLLTNLSIKNLGYDLNTYKQLLGGILWIRYNEIYSSLDINTNKERRDIFIKINFRHFKKQNLLFEIRAYNESDEEIYADNISNDSNFVLKYSYPGGFKYLKLKVYDAEGNLIDKIDRIAFISDISFNLSYKVGELIIEEGKDKKMIEKYVRKISSTKKGKKKESLPVKSLFDSSEEYSYRKFEESLDFVFFSGSKDEEERKENKRRAKEAIMRILNSAIQTIYICDSYFGPEEIESYIYAMSYTDTTVNVLSSKERVQRWQYDEILKDIEFLEKNNYTPLRFKVLRGNKSPLHDRLIIADDNVWMIGSSLNEIGERASAIIRVPKEYAGKIKRQIEKWWNDNNITESIG